MVTNKKGQFSDKTTQLELPINFIDCVQGLTADSFLVLIAFFQFT